MKAINATKTLTNIYEISCECGYTFNTNSWYCYSKTSENSMKLEENYKPLVLEALVDYSYKYKVDGTIIRESITTTRTLE